MLVGYDPEWPSRFDRLASELRRAGKPSWLIEHIGSTAIPGLPAKPIIDLAVRIDDDRDVEVHRPGLEAVGWFVGSGVRTHRVMIREAQGVRVAIAHFFPADAWDTASQRLFRDWLLGHPEDCERYEEVKRTASANAAAGTGVYNAGKTAFVQEIVDRARGALGLPPVPAYDK